MKKLLLIVGIILISFSLATAAYAATLNYTVSATTIETGTDFTATFSITLPEHEESYAGFEITIKLPEGGDLRNVNYGTNQGNAVTPQQDSSGSWHIFRFDLTNVFKNSIVVTFVIDYIAETPGTIVIEEVTTVRLSGVGMTDTYIGGPTNITINPYIPTLPTFSIVASASPLAGGSVTGGGTFEQGADVTLTATANSGYVFEGWFEGEASVWEQATYAFKAAADRTLVARFKVEEVVVPTFVISVSVEPENGGSVTGGGEYDKDADVTLTAAANDGYEFIGWYENDELISEDTELSFKAEADRDLVALFKVVGEEVETVTITVSANPAAGGSATGGGTYDKGADVALTATANSGYRFVGWFEGGVSVSATAAYTFEAASDRTLEARFEVVSGGTQNPGGGGPGGGGSTGNVTPASPAPTIIEAPEEEPPLGAAEPEPEFLLRLDKDRTEGYIHGYPDGTFGPNNNITRYETAVMFYNLVKDPDKASFTSAVEKFSDVPTDQWFSEAVGYLVTRGVLLGYPDGEFKGDNNITRAEFVTIASKFDETSLLNDISFPDVDDSHWAYDYIKSAYNNHWITGYPDGTFGPENMITRAEAVVIINRMLEWDPAEAKGENPFSDIEPGDWYYNDVLLAANGR